MNLKKKYFILFLFFLFFYGCGFTPVYKNIKNLDFSIKINEFYGNKKINNKIETKLNTYKSDEKSKIYEINFESKYFKNILTKNLSGAATEYKIVLETIFYVKSDGLQKEYKFSESFNMQSFNDKLEEQDYENSIQDSLTNIITRKLILRLSQVK